MSDFQNYLLQQARKDEAFQRYNYAAAKLENAQIHERLAEIKSQHEPLSSLATKALSERDRLYAAAYYVVCGRMPDSSRTTSGDAK